jgi:flagellar biosynthesis chaperone FliJ
MSDKIAQAKRALIIEMMHYNQQIKAIQHSITSAVNGIDMLKAGVDNAFDKLLRELDEVQG